MLRVFEAFARSQQCAFHLAGTSTCRPSSRGREMTGEMQKEVREGVSKKKRCVAMGRRTEANDGVEKRKKNLSRDARAPLPSGFPQTDVRGSCRRRTGRRTLRVRDRDGVLEWPLRP